MVFTVSLVTGKELWLTNTIQTIMLPLVIWYYGNIAYRYGYQHSVSGTADIRCAWISMLAMLIVQFAFIFASMHEATIKPEEMCIRDSQNREHPASIPLCSYSGIPQRSGCRPQSEMCFQQVLPL